MFWVLLPNKPLHSFPYWFYALENWSVLWCIWSGWEYFVFAVCIGYGDDLRCTGCVEEFGCSDTVDIDDRMTCFVEFPPFPAFFRAIGSVASSAIISFACEVDANKSTGICSVFLGVV